MLPTNGQPKESYGFALELQEGLKKIHFPVLWIKAEPGTMVSQNNPIGLGRLEDLQKRLPSMEVRDFGEGFHYLTEENPERVVQMITAWINELK